LNIKKEVFIGFFVGVIANFIGLILATLILGKGESIGVSLKQSVAEDFFGKLVAVGAILNLVVFFIFLGKKQDYRARGVILATVLVAVFTFLFKYL
jgi:hypothetical protein